MQFKLIHKGIVLVAVPVGFSLVILIYLTALLQRADTQAEEQLAAQSFISSVEDVQAERMISKAAMGMFILSRAPKYAARHKETHQAIDAGLHDLYRLCQETDREKAMIVRRLLLREDQHYPWERLIMSSASKLNNLLMLLPTDDRRPWTDYDQSGPLFDRLVASERLVEQSTTTDLIKIWHQTQLTLVLSISISLFLTVGLAVYFNRNIRARLYNIRHNTIQIAGNEELLAPLAGNDEITELDLAVHETARQIKALEVEKRSLSRAMAERLKDPLEAIKSTLAHLLHSGSLNTAGLRNLNAADKSVDRLIRMVSDLLHLDELEDSRLQMTLDDVRIDDVIKLSKEAVEQPAREKHIQIDVQQSNLTVWADRDRLVQAVINLLANAIKFSPESSVISINVEESHGLARLSIMDRGRGMPEEFQKRLFRRFSQALASDAEDKKGFGLGLAITKQIIDQHKGEISFTSKPGEGTTFTISLHREPSTGNQDLVPPSPPLKPSAWLATGTSLRQKGLLLVGLPLLFQILFAVALSTLLWHSYERVSAAAHARQVASQCTVTLRKTDDMFLAAFSGALKGQSEITTSYADTKKQLRSSLLQLIALADSDELPAARKIEHTTSVISNKLDNIFRSNTLRMSDIIAGAQKENQQEIDLMMDDVQDALTQLKNYEKNFEAKDPIARQTIRQQILWLLLIGFAANVSMALLLLHYLSASIRKRLMNILENANRLLRRDPMLLPADGTDEIAEIDRTFCKTAERLFSLEQFKDELLSVVSHDLRTPICSLQGYLLMVTNGLVGTLPEALLDEVTATEAEAERLVGFINDLLTAEKMKTSRGDPL